MKQPFPFSSDFESLTMAAELTAFGNFSAKEFAEIISDYTPQIQDVIIEYSNAFGDEYNQWITYQETQSAKDLFTYKVKRELSKLILETLKTLLK